MLCRTIDAVRRAIPQAEIILTIGRDALDLWRKICDEEGFSSPQTVIGGDTRFQSVKNGIEAIKTKVTPNDIIMIHDGARPFVDSDLCQRLIEQVRRHKAVVPAIAVTDSLRVITPGSGSHAVDRSVYRSVQTPQAFMANVIINAYDTEYLPTFTDDASVVENMGYEISLTQGSDTNIKITHPADLAVAEAILLNQDS